MKRIINGKRYDTDTAECLIERSWNTYHPNQGGGDPRLRHERAIYRTKSGALFSYQLDEIGYGRDRNGVTGLYERREEDIIPLGGNADAIGMCEQFDFDPDDVAKHFELEDA